MNCEWVKKNITLYVFEELGDSDRTEVSQHLERCAECAREAEAEQQLRRVLDLRPKIEPSAALLAQCRSELAEVLESQPAPGAGPWAWLQRVTAPWHALRLEWQAGLAVLLLSVGFTGGTQWTRWQAARGGETGAPLNVANIANINSINARPDGGLEIAVDTLNRRVVSGRPSDPRIQQLLVAALNNYNSGIRLDSIEMLKSRAENDAIRAALVSSLKNDRNPGVRLKALESLRGFEADALVRSALLQAAVRDGNPAVRIEAIDQLAKQRDQTVILTLQQLAERDPNTFIRMKSANRLREWNAPETTY
jgi:hypothetical protein